MLRFAIAPQAQTSEAGSVDTGPIDSRRGRLLLARIYLAVVFVCTPFAIYTGLARPTVSQDFFFEATALLGVFFYSAGRLTGLISAPPRDPLRLWIVLYAAALAAAAYLSDVRGYTARRCLFPLAGIAFYMIVFAFPWRRRDMARLVACLSVSAFLAAAYGVIQSLGVEILPYAEEEREGKMKILSVFGHPNYAASYLGPVFLLLLSLRFWRQRSALPSRRMAAIVGGAALAAGLVSAAIFFSVGLIWLGLVAALGAAAWAIGRFQALAAVILILFFLLAGARGVWLALISAALFALLFWGAKAKWSVRAGAKWIAGAAIGLGAFGAACLWTPLGAYLARRTAETRPIASRVYAFVLAVEMIKQRPLLGWGYANYETHYFDEVMKFQRRPGAEIYNAYLMLSEGVPPKNVHNDLLEIAVDCGLIGVFAVLGMAVAFGLSMARALRASADSRDSALLLGILLALGCLAIDGLFSFPLRLPCSAVLFWGLLGIGSRLGASRPADQNPA